jgi:hypothetical protein
MPILWVIYSFLSQPDSISWWNEAWSKGKATWHSDGPEKQLVDFYDLLVKDLPSTGWVLVFPDHSDCCTEFTI